MISIKISLKLIPKGPINNIPALVQIMAWRRPGDKPLSEPMLVSLLTHICVTRPQWVKSLRSNLSLEEGIRCCCICTTPVPKLLDTQHVHLYIFNRQYLLYWFEEIFWSHNQVDIVVTWSLINVILLVISGSLLNVGAFSRLKTEMCSKELSLCRRWLGTTESHEKLTCHGLHLVLMSQLNMWG